MRKIHGTAVWGRVKRDYLIGLSNEWYRFDTIEGANFGVFRRRAQSSVDSPAKREPIVSRARTCTARAPSTITSAGRGREL